MISLCFVFKGHGSDRNNSGSIAFGSELEFPYMRALNLIQNALDTRLTVGLNLALNSQESQRTPWKHSGRKY